MNNAYTKGFGTEDYLRLAGIVKDKAFIGPEKVSIETTNACNYNCLYCFLYSKLIKRKVKIKHIPFGLFKNIIEDCASMRVKEIALIGRGESFMHHRIYDMIEYVKSKGLKLSFHTNGSFHIRNIRSLSKVDNITINLSAATEETYKKLQCNRPHSFQDVITNIKILSRIRQSKGTPKIQIIYVINSLNLSEVEDIIALGKRLNIDFIHFRFIWTILEVKELMVSQNDIVRFHSIIKNFISQKDQFIQKTNLQNLSNMISKTKLCSIKISPFHLSERKKKMLYYGKDLDDNFRCYIGWYITTIDLEGEVYPCGCNWPIFSAGNVYHNSFRDIWRGDKFSKIRTKLKYSFDIKNRFWQRCRFCLDYEFVNNIYKRFNRFNSLFKF
jgi:MoaA/NifB/PqqE/SkfB family radical SAM enzyme